MEEFLAAAENTFLDPISKCGVVFWAGADSRIYTWSDYWGVAKVDDLAIVNAIINRRLTEWVDAWVEDKTNDET